MNGDKPLETPLHQYYKTIEQGYKESGLDLEYLKTALNNAIEAEEAECEEYEDMELEDYEPDDFEEIVGMEMDIF